MRAAEVVLAKLPSINSINKLKRKVTAIRTAYDRLFYYGQIYEPYLNLSCRFEVKNTQRLFNSLSEDEKGALGFDISSLNWRHYIQNVHIPGVKKHILKLEGGGALEVEEAASKAIPTINSLLTRAAKNFPDKTALQIKRDEVWQRFTYQAMEETARKIGRILQRAGLQKGDRVVLFSENKPEWGMAYLGAASVGVVVVPLDAQRGGPVHSSAQCVVDHPVWRLVHALSTLYDPKENRVLVDGFYDDLLKPDEEDLALIDELAIRYQGRENSAIPSLAPGKVNQFINGETGRDLFLRYCFQPTMNINGLRAGYTGPGTLLWTLPNAAYCTIDHRLPPDLDPHQR